MANLSPTIVALIIILGSSCLCNVEGGDKSLTLKEYDYWFNYVFCDVGGPFDTPTVMTALMLVHGHTPSVYPNRKEIVEFWHDAVMDKQEHCTFAYITKLKSEQRKYLDLEYKKNAIHDFVYRKVIQDCMQRFVNGVKRAEPLNRDDRSLVGQLYNIWAKKTEDKLTGELVEELNKRAAKLIGPTIPAAARQNKEDFVRAWRSEGACQKQLERLGRPTLELEKFYKEFEVSYKPYGSDASIASEWINYIEGCEYFLEDKTLYEIWPYVQQS